MSGIMVSLDLQDTYGRSNFADNKQYASHLNIQLSSPFNSAMSNVSTYIERFLNKAMLNKQCTNATLDNQYLTTFSTHCAPSLGIKNHEWNAIVEIQNQRGWDLHTTITYAIHYSASDKTNVCGAQSVKTQPVLNDTSQIADTLKEHKDVIIQWFAKTLKQIKKQYNETRINLSLSDISAYLLLDQTRE